MRESIRTGVGFGFTSAIITTLGLMIGLFSGTRSSLVVIGGIITIAIADAFSDALGIHISEETKKRSGKKAIWEATITTLLTKFFVALAFLIPIFILKLSVAIVVNVVLGIVLLSLFSYFLAKRRGERPIMAILEHDAIAVAVIAITYFVGLGIKYWFG
jgi:VIT1/CCC1 family predicted Fe2+/Mn2+ transporter